MNNSGILIIGGDSAIGSELVKKFKSLGRIVFQTTRRTDTLSQERSFLDLSQDCTSWILPSCMIDVAVICAGVTSIKECERNPKYSRIINVTQTLRIIEKIITADIFIIFISSNAVFDGEKPFVKTIDDVHPQNEYGRQKVEVENMLLPYIDHVSILRFGKVITPHMLLFTKWTKDLYDGKPIHPFYDSGIAPLSLRMACDLIARIADKKKHGITQLSATSDISYFQAAQYISHHAGFFDYLIQPISSQNTQLTFSQKYFTLDSETARDIEIIPPNPYKALDYFLSIYRYE